MSSVFPLSFKKRKISPDTMLYWVTEQEKLSANGEFTDGNAHPRDDSQAIGSVSVWIPSAGKSVAPVMS